MERYFGVPQALLYPDFLKLSDKLRLKIVENNRVLQTDTYNRTMDYIEGPEGQMNATYALQLRRSPHGYIMAMGMRNIAEQLSLPITQDELDFATQFHETEAKIPYFNRETWQNIIDNYGGYIPIRVDCVPEGTAVLPGDPIIRVTGPSELVAHFEPMFHRVFYPSMVATTAHVINRAFPGRFIEVGKRGTATEETHLIAARSMFAMGIDMTSNDAAAAAFPGLKDVGTLGHRFIQGVSIKECMGVRDAFVKAIEKTDAVALLVDLTDSYEGIAYALELKELYRNSGKRISIRLDSGNVAEQTVYCLQEYAARGFTDPSRDKVIVENISTVDDMRAIDEMVRQHGFDPEKFVTYGAGGLLVSQGTTRSDASSAFKLARIGEYPTMKFSDSPGKHSIPGEPTVFNTRDGRVIGQAGERLGKDVFVPAYRYPGKVLLPENIEMIRQVAEVTFKDIAGRIGKTTPHSPATQAMEQTIRAHYHQ